MNKPMNSSTYSRLAVGLLVGVLTACFLACGGLGEPRERDPFAPKVTEDEEKTEADAKSADTKTNSEGDVETQAKTSAQPAEQPPAKPEPEANPWMVSWKINEKPMGRFDSPDWKTFHWVVDDPRNEGQKANFDMPATGSERKDWLEAERLGYAWRVPLGAKVRLIKRHHWGSKWFFEDVLIEVLEGEHEGKVGWISLTDLENPMGLPEIDHVADYAAKYAQWEKERLEPTPEEKEAKRIAETEQKASRLLDSAKRAVASGKKDAAIRWLSIIEKNYPTTETAKEAAQMMKELR